MNTPVSFLLSKVLKEKGFDENCSDYYTALGDLNSNGWGDIIYEQGFSSGEPDRMLRFNYSDFNKYQKETCFLCPNISDVVMWLYKEHKIWISVDPDNDTDTWFYTISHNKSETVFGNYSGPTECYEKAIEHVLNNMI